MNDNALLTKHVLARAPRPACTAVAASIWSFVGVGLVVRMALRAMRLGKPMLTGNVRRSAAQSIHAVRNGFQVRRPNTVAVSAPTFSNVIPDEPDRRFTDEKMMSEVNVAGTNLKRPVALPIQAAQPQGAAVRATRIDMTPKECIGIGWAGVLVILRAHRVTSGVLGRAFTALRPLNFTTVSP